MNQRDALRRVLTSLHDATLDDALWPATSNLIDEACGATGSSIIVSEGAGSDANILFARNYHRGHRRADLERDYFQNYFAHDERIPRLRRLSYNRLVHVSNLYSAEELQTSPTYNEALPRMGTQNGLNVRLRGPHDSRVIWAIADPVGTNWRSGQIRMVRRLLPHIRQFVGFRQALASAEAKGSSFVSLLDSARVGVIHLDRRGRILAASDRARADLGQGNGLWDRGGFLHAWLPADDTRLKRLVARALLAPGGQAAGGSMLIRHPSGLRGLMVHIHPATVRQMDFGALEVGALVLIADLDRASGIDADVVAPVLGLTPAESRVAVLLAEGKTVHDIAVASGRAESSVRSHLKRIHRKLGISRRADLVHLVRSAGEFSVSRR